MTEGDPAGSKATPVAMRIGTMTQINGALARMQRGGLPLLMLFVVTSVLSAGLYFPARAMSIDLDTPSLTAGFVAYAVLDSLISALGMSLALRLMVEGGDRWMRLDRGLAESMVLLSLATLGFTAINLLLATDPSTTQKPGGAVLRVSGGLVGYVVFIWLSLKLALWPAGRLMGRLDVTPVRSWRLMRKATRGYFLALLLGILPMLALVILALQLEAFDTTVGRVTSLASAVIGVAYAFYGEALLATLFALRVEAPTSVADVFA